jgi:uncharacterized protein YndB with AHSA1/START domain
LRYLAILNSGIFSHQNVHTLIGHFIENLLPFLSELAYICGIYNQVIMTQKVEETIIINASPYTVWETLTNTTFMKKWMGEPEMQLEIITDWNVGSAIVIKGFHHIKFENKGTILHFEPNKLLKYDYLSSISRLPDQPENYTTIEFALNPLENQTALTLTLSNFPTESIFKHVGFYWRTTIHIMKNFAERLNS